MQSKLIIKTDITDWMQRTQMEEIVVKDENDIVELVTTKSGLSTGDVARAMVVCDELGLTEKRISPVSKSLIESAARSHVSSIVARRSVESRINGKDVRHRQYAGRPTINEDGDVGEKEYDFLLEPIRAQGENIVEENVPDYVLVGTEKAVERAVRYIFNNVTGHIQSRLVQIAVGKGDVRSVARELIGKIEAMAEEYG